MAESDLTGLSTIRVPRFGTYRYPGFYGQGVDPTVPVAPVGTESPIAGPVIPDGTTQDNRGGESGNPPGPTGPTSGTSGLAGISEDATSPSPSPSPDLGIGFDAAQGFSNAAKGVGLGLGFGPIGAAIGGLIGLGTGLSFGQDAPGAAGGAGPDAGGVGVGAGVGPGPSGGPAAEGVGPSAEASAAADAAGVGVGVGVGNSPGAAAAAGNAPGVGTGVGSAPGANDASATGPGSDGADGGGCYLTTACMQNSEDPVAAAGDLQTLRQWRDEVLGTSPTGKMAVEAYYQTAPQITADISNRPDAPQVFQQLHADYIRPAVEAIRAGDNAAAMQIYVQGLKAAQRAGAKPHAGEQGPQFIQTTPQAQGRENLAAVVPPGR